ncbi:hypothetical protein LGM57_10790 [Burkholderia cepacia]|uniref:hypothetical protein n=1 Tax=Burkholderia cepacia TaxID=292 RepID=UPI001CF513BD|nr:hypothetical protein [Burkholderia cepacia]MCA7976806.1 hypothetical protein [Burkholderia cepacia]
MATTKLKLCEAVLTGSAALVYGPVPTNSTVTVQAISAWNPGASPVSVDVFIVPSGGSATDATHVGHASIGAGRTGVIPEVLNQALAAGDELFATGNGCTLTASGVLISN